MNKEMQNINGLLTELNQSIKELDKVLDKTMDIHFATQVIHRDICDCKCTGHDCEKCRSAQYNEYQVTKKI